MGIDKGVECELSEDPNTNDQQCAAIGAVSGGNGDLGADRFDMELTDSLNNEIPVPHTAFVNILDDPAAIEAAALVGVDFETYTLTEEQLVLLDNSTVPVIPTDPFNPPIGCNALLEEPGFAITGVIPNLPDSVDIDNVGFDVGICVIMDTTCGVDGLLVNENATTVEPECEVSNAIVPAEFIDAVPLGIDKGVECELSEDPNTNDQQCAAIGAVSGGNGDLGADRFDMELTDSLNNEIPVPHTAFVNILDDPAAIEAAALVGVDFETYTLTEEQLVLLDNSTVPVIPTDPFNPPIGCNALLEEPGFAITGVIPNLPDSVDIDNVGFDVGICVIMDTTCGVDGLLLSATRSTIEPECEVSNAIVPAEFIDAVPLGIDKGVECELSEDPNTNDQQCAAIGAVSGGNGDLGADRFDMELTDSLNNEIPVPHTAFVNILDDPAAIEAAALVGVDFETYTLTEEQLVLLDNSTVPVIPTDPFNPPIGCNALLEEPGFAITGVIPNLPDSVDIDNVGFDVGICVIMDTTCGVDGLEVNATTVEPECEVSNAIVPAEFIDAVPLGIDKGVECELSEDPNTNDQQCAAIGAVSGGNGDLGADRFDMELTDSLNNEIPVPHTAFVNILDDPAAIEAAALVGVDFETYTLTEEQLVLLDNSTVPVIPTDPFNPPIGCNALLEEPGFAITGVIPNLPDSVDIDNVGFDVGICVIMDTTCGVDGLEVNATTVEPECEVSNAIVPAEFIDAVPLGIDKGVECELSEDLVTNAQLCSDIGAETSGNIGPDRFDMTLNNGTDDFPIDHTQFVNIAPAEAAALVGVPFGTYTLTENQLIALDNVTTATVIPTDPNNPPVGCNALLEGEPGLDVVGVISDLPDTLDFDVIGIDVGICVIMDTTCGVDGLLVNENTIEPECEVSNAIVPAEFINAVPVEIEKGVECELLEDETQNAIACNNAGFVDNGDFGADRYDMQLTQFNNTVETGTAIINHTEFIPDGTTEDVDAAVLVGLEPGFTYTLAELQAVTIGGTVFEVEDTPSTLCDNVELDLGTQLTGSIDVGDEIICVAVNDACVDGLEVTDQSIDLECEVSNIAIQNET